MCPLRVLAMIFCMVDSLGIHLKRKAICKGNENTWNGGFGRCEAYGPTGQNHLYCSSDVDSQTGLLASQACPDCGMCAANFAEDGIQTAHVFEEYPEKLAYGKLIPERKPAVEHKAKEKKHKAKEKRIWSGSEDLSNQLPHTFEELLDLNNGDVDKTQRMWEESIPVEDPEEEQSNKTLVTEDINAIDAKTVETNDLYLCTITEDSNAENPSPGDKWLAKSAMVSIQGHYLPVDNDDALTGGTVFMRKVAIGGAFLQGNIMVVGSLQDGITWNGEPILEDQTSSFSDTSVHVKARRSHQSSLVQDLSIENPGVNIDLPMNVSLIVNRLHDWVNVAIQMPLQEEYQGGLCGGPGVPDGAEGVELNSKQSRWDVSSEDTLF